MNSALEKLGEIYAMLEDKTSKELYINRLSYYISGNRKYTDNIVNSYMRKLPFGYSDLESRVYGLRMSLPEEKNFVLYGAGIEGAQLLPYCMSDKRFVGFCSSTEAKQKNGYLGFPVISPEELFSRKDLSVIISTHNFRDDLIQALKDGGYPPELIFDGPAFYSQASSEAEQYFGPKFLKFEDEEIFVDVGCYDFGSSLAMAAHCRCKKVYAFEPDPENYQKCLKNIARRNQNRIFDVKIFPYGTWSEKSALCFNASGSGGSSIRAANLGNSTVSVVTIDESIDPNDRVTMIKMDVEGAELESLKGAKETIRRDKPKLAVCIYHKVEDMWEIPLYIKKLVPEYRLYIRHHSSDLAETVLYAVMP